MRVTLSATSEVSRLRVQTTAALDSMSSDSSSTFSTPGGNGVIHAGQPDRQSQLGLEHGPTGVHPAAHGESGHLRYLGLELTVELTPNMLWPPNHKMRSITATITTNLAPELVTVVLAEVVSNEPDNGTGDGNTIDDIQGHDIGNPDFEFEVRAERSGKGNGRIYSVTYIASTITGDRSTVVRHVLVPHDQGGSSEPLTISVEDRQDGTVVGWKAVPNVMHTSPIRKITGVILTLAYVVLVFGFNLGVAHYRDALGGDGEEDSKPE